MMMMEEDDGVIKDVFRQYNGFAVPLAVSVRTERVSEFESSDSRTNAAKHKLTINSVVILQTASAQASDDDSDLSGKFIIVKYEEWSQCEVNRGVRLHFCQQWSLQYNHKTVERIVPVGLSTNTQGELLSSLSPSGHRRAVIKETSANDKGHQYLEVWGFNGLERSLNLTAISKHGKVYGDAQFACLAWSPGEEKLLYVAEKKESGPTGETSSSDNEIKKRNVYREDWGEGLAGKSVPVLCVVDVSKGEVTVCPGIPSHLSPGQALWAGDGKGVLFVGWWHEPFRLGLKFCTNRRSALFYLDLKGNCELLSSDSGSVLSPRLSPDHRWLVYLQGRVFGPHHQCLCMMLYDFQNRKNSVLVDVVRRAEKGQFAGLYESLPPHCWSVDSERVFFSSACGNSRLVFSVERRTGQVASVFDSNALATEQMFGSVKLLTVEQNLMVMSCSSPNRPPVLKVALVPDGGQIQCDEWYHLGGTDLCESFQWRSVIITPPSEEENHQYSGVHFGAVLLKPASRCSGVKFSLVVFIHGGPHSHFAAEWNVNAAALTKLGFAVLMVNYRGSTGFGQDSINSLLGNIGSQDVKDVQGAVLHVLQEDGSLDAGRVAVLGGSHGGFLACHLIGQYPDFYRACAVRNPVINAATLLGTSDIVDWRYSSVGLPYSYEELPTPQALTAMLESSPIVHAAQIHAPVLLMLGGKDKRVSPYQGLELYKALKSRNSPVRLLWFDDDGHSLSKVETQSDCFLNVALWFKQHLNMK